MHTCPFCHGTRVCPNSKTKNHVAFSINLPGCRACGIIWCGHVESAEEFKGKLAKHPCGACHGTGEVNNALYYRMTQQISGRTRF